MELFNALKGYYIYERKNHTEKICKVPLRVINSSNNYILTLVTLDKIQSIELRKLNL